MKRFYDYIVIGSGLAGTYTSMLAAEHGKVALVSKSAITESNSYYAQGGIAAVTDKNDIPRYHFDDTIVAGRGLCDYPAVEALVNEGPQRIREIIDLGMKFDITESGELALGLEGGHHRRRILHAGGDATGRFTTSFVIDQVKKHPNIDIIENCSLIDLLIENGVCRGARCWDYGKGEEILFEGKFTMMACGGLSAIYNRTTNPSTTTGDGFAVAYNAGCKIRDIEFVQFHPTAIATPEGNSFLVSEAVRGEGAHLYNLKGERFMLGAHELAELAPRDVVAKKINEQIKAEGKGYVYLSLKHLDPEHIKSRFPTIFAKCEELGIDMTDRIPIAPAAHYTVGGVETDLEGKSAIENLYICGELASTGIMGANRLASNSLIECLVFGKRSIDDSAKRNIPEVHSDFKEMYFEDPDMQAQYARMRHTIADLMTEHAGIVRTKELLEEGLRKLERLKKDFEAGLPRTAGRDYAYEIHSNQIRNLILTSELIINGALNREESRGCHYREDFPEERDAFHKHIIQQKGKEIAMTEVEM